MGEVVFFPLDETCQLAGPAVTFPGAVVSWKVLYDEVGEEWALTVVDVSIDVSWMVPAVFRREYAHRYAKNMRRPAGWRLTGRVWGYPRLGWASSTPVRWKVAVRRWDRLHG